MSLIVSDISKKMRYSFLEEILEAVNQMQISRTYIELMCKEDRHDLQRSKQDDQDQMNGKNEKSQDDSLSQS